MILLRLTVKILGGGIYLRWKDSRCRGQLITLCFWCIRTPTLCCHQKEDGGPRNHGKHCFRLIHNEIIQNNNDDNKVLALSFSKNLWTTYYVPSSKICKDSSSFKWGRKILALINNTFASFFISNDLIALDHCQVLGDKIPGITWLLSNPSEKQISGFITQEVPYSPHEGWGPQDTKNAIQFIYLWFIWIHLRNISLIYRTEFPWIF